MPFSFDILRDMAETLAGQPYAPAAVPDAELLELIDYDLHNQITYRKDAMLWADVPGAAQVRFFHPGRYFKEPVEISVLEEGTAREILFSTDLFDMPEGHPARKLTHAGFAGFAVMDPEGRNDWMAVLGASYFRTSGYSGQFGMSARGLAIDSGRAGAGGVPPLHPLLAGAGAGGGDRHLRACSRARGRPAPTGWRPRTADGVFQDIEAALFLRGHVDRLGIAPLTSMFWYGKNNHFVGPDWRPEIHDSDGLEMQLASGERIWRPLNNPPRVMANSFRADGLMGFGLAQRERSFEQYQDDGVFYEKRATCWITPQGDWGLGSVMLVELSTNDEIHDNVVAFWNPAAPAVAGSRYDLRYKLDWVEDSPPQTVARFIATRIGAGGRAGAAAAGEPGEVRLRPGRQGAGGAGPLERGRGGGRGEPGDAEPGLRLPDRHHRPLAGDVRPRHRPAGGGRRADRPQDVPAPRGAGDVGDLDLPGLPVADAPAAGGAGVSGFRTRSCT